MSRSVSGGLASPSLGYVRAMDAREREKLPTAEREYENMAAGDVAREEPLTEDAYPTPAERADVASERVLDP